MSEPALSLAFFDPEHGLYGTARAGATLLFDGDGSNVLPAGPAIAESGGKWSAELDGAFDLTLEPVATPRGWAAWTLTCARSRARWAPRR